MKIRNREYTVYKGKTYRLGSETKTTISLISHDDNDLNNGFTDITNKYDEIKFYRKTISKKDLGTVIYIKSYAIYQGYKLTILSEKEEKLLLIGGQEMMEYGFEWFDRGDQYSKWVPFSDVEIIEEREPAPYFLK